MRRISSPCAAPAVSLTQWWGIQSKKTHLLQGLQILLRDKKNWGLHLQIASLFFEPVERRKKKKKKTETVAIIWTEKKTKGKDPLQDGWEIILF